MHYNFSWNFVKLAETLWNSMKLSVKLSWNFKPFFISWSFISLGEEVKLLLFCGTGSFQSRVKGGTYFWAEVKSSGRGGGETTSLELGIMILDHNCRKKEKVHYNFSYYILIKMSRFKLIYVLINLCRVTMRGWAWWVPGADLKPVGK